MGLYLVPYLEAYANGKEFLTYGHSINLNKADIHNLEELQKHLTRGSVSFTEKRHRF